MKNCDKCKKEYFEDEIAYQITVTECSTDDIGANGSIEVDIDICYDCYHRNFYDLNKISNHKETP